tara:strand:- start:53 stop:304 length:252 start_codon:yes stop_codon:yes gene_type:complete
MDLKKILQILGIVALSLLIVQLIFGLFIAFSIGGFISSAFDKFKGEDIDLSKFKIEINKEDSNTENDRVLIIRDKDTLINIQD